MVMSGPEKAYADWKVRQAVLNQQEQRNQTEAIEAFGRLPPEPDQAAPDQAAPHTATKGRKKGAGK